MLCDCMDFVQQAGTGVPWCKVFREQVTPEYKPCKQKQFILFEVESEMRITDFDTLEDAIEYYREMLESRGSRCNHYYIEVIAEKKRSYIIVPKTWIVEHPTLGIEEFVKEANEVTKDIKRRMGVIENQIMESINHV